MTVLKNILLVKAYSILRSEMKHVLKTYNSRGLKGAVSKWYKGGCMRQNRTV